jgi:hypothetical protein
VRRIAAVAVALALFAGPLFASKTDIKKKEAAKEKAAVTKAGDPAKPAAGEACAAPTAADGTKVPPTGSAGFFQTVEDIYAFQGPVADLVATPAAPEKAPAPAAKSDKSAKSEKSDKKEEPKKKAD